MLSPTTVTRLRHVAAIIAANPERFDMGQWSSRLKDTNAPLAHAFECRTTCCIAGWYHFLTPVEERQPKGFSGGTLWSQLPRNAFNTLAHTSDWSEPYKSRYYQANTERARAKVAVARIHAFIEEWHGQT